MRTITLALVLLLLSGCSGTTQERQAQADHLFGIAKVAYIAASGLVGAYNLFPPCGPAASPPLCYSNAVGDVLNKGLEGTSTVIESTEKVYAASNTDADARTRAAQAALAAVTELTAALNHYGVRK